MRDLGDLGEDQLKIWCTSVGMTASKPSKDKNGWDFLVELPFVSVPNVFMDAQPPQICCKIQVKASDRNKGSLPIKVSNLRKLAIDPLPTFILFLEYNGTSSPIDAYLVHLDHALIGEILKKVRELEAIKKTTQLHKHTLTIQYNTSHKLESIDGMGLMEKIKSYIGSDYSKYLESKRKITRLVGYETICKTVEFTTDTSNKNIINEMFLGYQHKASVNDFKMFDIRFDIPIEQKELNSSEAIISLLGVSNAIKGTLKFNISKLKSVQFDAEMYLTPCSNDFRVKCEIFSIRKYTKNNRFTVTFESSYEKNHEIQKIKKYLQLVTTLSIKGKYQFEFSFEENPQEIKWNAIVKKDNKIHSHPSHQLYDSIVKLEKIIHLLESDSNIAVNCMDIGRFKNNINELFMLLTENHLNFKMSFIDDNYTVDKNKSYIGLFHYVLFIGGMALCTIISFVGSLSKQDNERCVLTSVDDKFTTHQKFIISSSENNVDNIIEREKENIFHQIKSDNVSIVFA